MVRLNNNSTALIVEKMLRACLNMLVFVCLARSLGAENVGQFGLIQAIFFIGHPIALFVNEQLLVKYLITDNRDCLNLQKVALILKYSATIFVYGTTLIFCHFYFDADFFKLIATYCLIHFINIDIIFFAFLRAEEKSVAILKSTSYVLVPLAALKIVAALIYQDLMGVIVLYCIEAALLSIVSWHTFHCHFEPTPTNKGTETTPSSLRELISSSSPLFISALLIVLYSRVDLFMIDAKLSAENLGHYTAVVKLSEAFSMIMTAYLASQLPRLLRERKQGIKQYNSALLKTMRKCIFFSLGCTTLTVLFAEQILLLLYGETYLPAKNTLIVHFLGTIFLIQGIVCTQWLIAENLQIYRVYRVLAGLILNIALNLYLIPKYGILGAACSTLVTQAFGSVFFNSLSKSTLPIFKLQLQSMFLVSTKN